MAGRSSTLPAGSANRWPRLLASGSWPSPTGSWSTGCGTLDSDGSLLAQAYAASAPDEGQRLLTAMDSVVDGRDLLRVVVGEEPRRRIDLSVLTPTGWRSAPRTAEQYAVQLVDTSRHAGFELARRPLA